MMCARRILFLVLLSCGACRDAAPETAAIPRPRPAVRAEQAAEVIEHAGTAVDRGDYARAVADLHEAIGIYQQSNMKEEEAATWMALAVVYMKIGGSQEARVALDRGRELARRSHLPKAMEVIDTVSRMQELMARNAPLEDVLRLYGKLCELTGTCTEVLPAGTDGAWDALRLLQQGRYAEGRALLREVLRRTSSHDLRAQFHAAIAGSFVYERNARAAIDAFIPAVEEVELATETLGGEEMIEAYLAARRKMYAEVLVELLAGQGRVEEALSYAERARGRAFLQMIGNRRIKPRDERLSAEMEALGVASRRLPPAEVQKARLRYRELLTRIKAADPEYSSLVHVEPLDVGAMQQQIAPGTTLVVYFVNETTVHAWLVERTRLDYLRLDVEIPDLRRAVCWAQSLANGGGDTRSMGADAPGCSPPMTSEEAFTALVGPLLPHIHNRKLILVPHGPLHYVPFAALRNPATKRYLVQDYVLTYAPSISALKFLRGKESRIEGRALVIGDPSGTGMRRLPGAKSEAGFVAARFGTRPVVGREARESLLHDVAGKFDLIHLGVHGDYNADAPLFSRLVLAPDATHDGSLEVHEILSGVDFSGVNLVVMSACGSGRGAPTGGDEVVGLTRAIHYAGSPAVISTLWDIEDEAAAVFMDEFYGRLLAGSTVADAMRGAQLALLGRAPYRDPSFWAAFTLSGDPVARWALNARE